MPEPASPKNDMASRKSSRPDDGPRKLRSACDACHSAKIRCSGGGVPCTRCEREYVTVEDLSNTETDEFTSAVYSAITATVQIWESPKAA